MSQPRSVLLFMSDEHPVFMAGCYGDGVAQTPALDAFAAGGAIFDSAYCASPICCPCRAAMMTSRHVHTVEVWDNASPLRSDWPTFAHRFAAAGYRTILCGKMHFVGPDQHHGFTERWVPDIYPATFEWTRSSRHAVPIQDHPKGQNRHPVFDAGPGRSWDMDYDDLVMQTAEHRLPDLLAGDQPFLLVISITGPHYPFQALPEYWSRYERADIPMPAWPANHRETEPTFVKWVRQSGQFDEPIPADIVRRARRAIYGRITMVDDCFKRILNLVDTHDRSDDLVLGYCSDHGDMLGEHELFYKNTAYEWSARVPLILRGPGIQPRRLAETVSLLDLGPTVAGLAGVPALDVPTDGRDLTPLLRGEREAEIGRAIVENYGEGLRRGIRTLVKGDWKLSLCHGEPGVLHHLATDPGEFTNLYDDPAHRATRDAMERELRADWGDPAEHDERRWQSEERRLAIIRAWADNRPNWQPDWRSFAVTSHANTPPSSGG